MATQPLAFLIVFLAVFTQSLSGFGSALVAMALLPPVIGLSLATPLVALVMITIEVVLLLRYRQALNIRAVWRIVLAALIGIPLGISFLIRLDGGLVLSALGVVIAAYALYALFDIRLPALIHPAWAYGFGFLAGLLGGAYNTSGPPVILYGNCRRWGAAEFKSNLQGFFVVTSLFVVLSHAWNRNLTGEVWRYYLLTLPAMALGVMLGTSLDTRLNPITFRRIVLVLLLGMGIRLIFA